MVQNKIDKIFWDMPDDIGIIIGGMTAGLVYLMTQGYFTMLDKLLLFMGAFTLFVIPLAFFVARSHIQNRRHRWQLQQK